MSGKEEVAAYDDSVRAASFQLSKAMISPEVLRELQKKNSLKGLLQVVAHVSLIVSFGAAQFALTRSASSFNKGLGWAFLVLQSMCMAFLFTGFHEMSHLTVFTQKYVNIVIGHIFGLVIFRPFNYYTFYHNNHHKFTGDPQRDPELQDSFIDLRLDNVVSYLCYLSGVPFWIDRSTTLLRHAVLSYVLPREELFLTKQTKRIMLQEARCYVFLYAVAAAICCVNLSVWELVWGLWLLPSLVAQPFLRFYLIAEHVGCPKGDNMLSNTRTTKTYGWYRFLAWQMPFHAEHHAFPFIPFHQVPRLYRELCKNPKCESVRHCNPNGENGYLGVHIGIIKSFFSVAKAKSK